MQNAPQQPLAAAKAAGNALARAQQLRAPFGFWVSCDRLLPSNFAVNAQRRMDQPSSTSGAAAQAGKRSAARLGGEAADLSAAPHGNHGDNHKTRSAHV
jgi:hypothetical protein